MGHCYFGVEPRGDGSVVVAAQGDDTVSVERFEAERADSSTLLRFVREQSRTPRVCIASTGRHALGLALAFGELPEAEVMLLRPAAAGRVSNAMAGRSKDANVALALARYARRAA